MKIMRATIGRLALAAALAAAPACLVQRGHAQAADTESGQVVELYLHSSRPVSLPGVTRVIVFDAEIVSAEVNGDVVTLFGLERGDTVAIATVNGKPTSIIVHVILRPSAPPPPSFHPDMERGSGMAGTDAQVSQYNGQTNLAVLNSLSWRQSSGNHTVDFLALTEDRTDAGQHIFNLRNGSFDYFTPRLELSALDFNQDLTGDMGQSRFQPYTVSNNVQLRGARATLVRGRDRYTIFAGTTIPFYFLTLARTRGIGGLTFHRQQTDKLSWFAATSFVDAPQTLTGGRLGNIMQTVGFRYAPGRNWLTDAVVGASNHGTLVRSNLGYMTTDWSAYASFLRSSPQFPLNQIQSLFAGTTSIRGGLIAGARRRMTENINYEHTLTDSGILSIGHAVSDYLNPSVGYRLSKSEMANFSYTFSRNTGGFNGGRMTGNRFATGLNSALPHGISNTVQARVGSVQDPLGLQSQDEFEFDDAVAMPMKFGTTMVSFSHNRVNPSLVQKLGAELGLLSPQLQELFQQDPSGFVTSDLPPEIRALLESQIPVSTSLSASFQTHFGRRLTASPNVSFTRSTSGRAGTEAWNHFFGYGMSYLLSPTLVLRSSLSNVWTTDATRHGLQRTMLLSFGVQKTFNGFPMAHAFTRSPRMIEGRVFRDDDIAGAYHSGERGFEGVDVQLDDGTVVRTDKQGRYRFAEVRDGLHHVSLNLAQFATPIRMTTPSEIVVDLSGRHIGSADFGLIDFARVMGTVFNDLRFEGKRQVDSVPIGDVRLLLTQDGKLVRTILVPAGGSFEVDNLDPGDYELAMEPSTVPPNYEVPTSKFPIHVAPVTTAAVDVPLRAMRSIAGHVYLKVAERLEEKEPDKMSIEGAPQKPSNNHGNHSRPNPSQQKEKDQRAPAVKLLPLAGVQLTADHTIVKTDAQGAFVLRGLPAGDLTVTILPVKPLPPGMKVPAGAVHLPAEPISIEGASIAISNADLLPYLTNLQEQSPGVIAARQP